MRATRQLICVGWAMGYLLTSALAQNPGEKVDMEVMKQIRSEGFERSRAMDTISYLTDVYGPRLTGSPQARVAGEWTVSRLNEWGLQNAQLEPWGPFGRGWSLQSCSVNLVGPNYSPLIAYPKAWSPSTPQTVRGEPIYLDANTEEELNKYRGKLGRAIVLISPPREVKAQFEPPATRQTVDALLGLANADPSVPRPRRGGGPGGAPNTGSPSNGTPAATTPTGAPIPAAGTPAPPETPAVATPAGANGEGANGEAAKPAAPEPRSAMQLQTDKWQLAYDEGAAVVIEAGRGDGGTVFLAAATMPRTPEPPRTNGEAPNPFSRGPRPWATDAPAILPQLVMAAEHYNRLVRMIQKGAHPQLEIDIASEYHADELNSFNVIAEIPGTDLKDEIVMLGAHFDSWHSGTGATDNAVGCGVALEAVRILQSIGAKPRRTIRVALWTGEEQGLLGSRAYVSEHFGKANTPTRGGTEGRPNPAASGNGEGAGASQAIGQTNGREGGQGGGRRRTTYELKPDHEKISAYYNLDNGTGKIRGIYLQGNEQLRSVFRTWLVPFADLEASTVTASNTGGTDHQSFDGIGIPGFQFIQDPLEYDTRTHHSSMDVFERIQEEDVKQAAVIMAAFVYNTSMRDEKLARKPLDGDIVTSTETTPAAPIAAPVAAPVGAATPPEPAASSR
jgi:carboxypeptidase Q